MMRVSNAYIRFTQRPEEAKRHAGKRVAIVDDEVIATANEHGIAMIFTGMRHFRR